MVRLFLTLILAASAAPAAALAQTRDPAGPAQPVPGSLGARGVTVAPAVVMGSEMPAADVRRPLSGTHRLGTVSTPDGSLLLTGTFRSGRLVHVTASRGRTRATSVKGSATLERALDEWRPLRPTGLPAPGGARQCGIEGTWIDVPATIGTEAALEAGTYVGVAWVCDVRTEDRWLFRVPPVQRPPADVEPAVQQPATAEPDTLP